MGINEIDDRIDRIYRQRCSGAPIHFMDVSKIFRVGREAVEAVEAVVDDQALGDKLAEFVETIRLDKPNMKVAA
jgi:hypothetical protein